MASTLAVIFLKRNICVQKGTREMTQFLSVCRHRKCEISHKSRSMSYSFITVSVTKIDKRQTDRNCVISCVFPSVQFANYWCYLALHVCSYNYITWHRILVRFFNFVLFLPSCLPQSCQEAERWQRAVRLIYCSASAHKVAGFGRCTMPSVKHVMLQDILFHHSVAR